MSGGVPRGGSSGSRDEIVEPREGESAAEFLSRITEERSKLSEAEKRIRRLERRFSGE